MQREYHLSHSIAYRISFLPTAASSPQFPSPLSYLTSGSVGADGVLRATFTRPIVVPGFLRSLGYVDIADAAVPLIAAYNAGSARLATSCSNDISQHVEAWNTVKVDFLK